jgi:hypothetical protein
MDAESYFDRRMTERERAVFEAGIALGSMYHQFVGTPVAADERVVRSLERAIERSAMLQPYRKEVKASIRREGLKRGRHMYDYGGLRAEDMELLVKVEFGRASVTARMKYIPELDYPLMYVESVA